MRRGYDLGIKAARRTAEKPLAMTLPAEFDEREIGRAVLEALDPNEQLTPAELDQRAWRLRQLLEHGYELEDAIVVARAEHVDLEVATALVARHGCSSRMAVRILL
jgi:tryptophan 2,3-dioxygenase